MDPERELKEAYARLKALHDNLPDRANRLIEPRYVEEFHAILALLQKHSSFDLSGFKVPTNAPQLVRLRNVILTHRAFPDSPLTTFALTKHPQRHTRST